VPLRASDPQLVAFLGHRLIASGPLAAVAAAVSRAETVGQPSRDREPILVFNAETGDQVDLDPGAMVPSPLVGATTPSDCVEPKDDAPSSPMDDAATLAGDGQRGRGRPRLGVVPREVTLLPRHWDWLAGQPGGASAALRRLVEQARLANAARDQVRTAQERAYRFMAAMLGNQPDFEEVTRALFAGDRARFRALSGSWPQDPRDVAWRLADAALPTE